MKEMINIIYLLPLIVTIHGFRTRIYGGLDARDGQFQYYAYLTAREGSRAYCGGSVIHKRWILTAAHCFKYDEVRHIKAQVGTLWRMGQGGVIYGIERRIPHEAYHPGSVLNDIALLRVNQNIVFNNKVQPVRLANIYTVTGDNDNVIFTGFGRLKDGVLPIRLKAITMKVYTYSVCIEVDKLILPNQICTVPSSGNGPCIGDSGGPLVNEQGVQIGIDSHASGECGEVAEIYTHVASFRAWIDGKIGQN